MVIKLLKDVEGTQKESIIDCDELTGKDMIEKNFAILFTKEIEEQEKTNFKGEIKMDIDKVDIVERVEKCMIGALSQMIAKSPSGMSEGTAADGGAMLYTGVTQLMGIATEGTKIYDKCNKVVLPAGSNAIKVLLDASDPWLAANAPIVYTVAEGAAKTEAKLAFDSKTITPVKQVLYIPVTEELLQDVQGLESQITGYSRGKMGQRCDDLVFNGNPATNGCYGILDSNVSSFVSTVSVSATPTVENLVAMENGIASQFDDSAEWFVNRKVWQLLAGAHTDYNNISFQVINVQEKTILGRKVNIVHSLPAGTLLLGSPRAITVAEPRINDVAAKSYDVLFKTDEVVFRLVKKIGSVPNFLKRQASDGTYVAGWARATFASA